MKLKEILNMEHYLEHECYCPGEIYSADGFFFQIFEGECECKELGRIDTDNNYFAKKPCMFVVCQSIDESNQILIIGYENDKILDIVRFDATENNLLLINDVLKNNETNRVFDEYEETRTQEKLEELFNLCDAVMLK